MKKVLFALVATVILCAGCAAVAADPAPAPDKVSADLVNGEDSICEINHAANSQWDFYGVYGATKLARGTVFTLILEHDNKIETFPMVAQAGSIYVNGKLYGHYDGYIDDGTNTNFGFSSADMPMLPVGHGLVNARVDQGGQTICTYGEG